MKTLTRIVPVVAVVLMMIFFMPVVAGTAEAICLFPFLC
jgi:hypothetical protein